MKDKDSEDPMGSVAVMLGAGILVVMLMMAMICSNPRDEKAFRSTVSYLVNPTPPPGYVSESLLGSKLFCRVYVPKH